MRLHQILVEERGVIHCRKLSCFCSYPGFCTCYKPMKTTFTTAVLNQQPTRYEERPQDPDIETQTRLHQTASPETQIDSICVDECLTERYAVVKYDGLSYPEFVMDVDGNEVEVKVVHTASGKTGRNRFYWPKPIEDVLWYQNENIVAVLDQEPQPVTGRHMQVDPVVWQQIEQQPGL